MFNISILQNSNLRQYISSGQREATVYDLPYTTYCFIFLDIFGQWLCKASEDQLNETERDIRTQSEKLSVVPNISLQEKKHFTHLQVRILPKLADQMEQLLMYPLQLSKQVTQKCVCFRNCRKRKLKMPHFNKKETGYIYDNCLVQIEKLYNIRHW